MGVKRHLIEHHWFLIFGNGWAIHNPSLIEFIYPAYGTLYILLIIHKISYFIIFKNMLKFCHILAQRGISTAQPGCSAAKLVHTARLHQPITSVSSVSVARVVDTRTDRTAGCQLIKLHPQRGDRGPNGRLVRFVACRSRAVISISQSWQAYFSVTKDNITNVSCCSFWKCSNINHLFFFIHLQINPFISWVQNPTGMSRYRTSWPAVLTCPSSSYCHGTPSAGWPTYCLLHKYELYTSY